MVHKVLRSNHYTWKHSRCVCEVYS